MQIGDFQEPVVESPLVSNLNMCSWKFLQLMMVGLKRRWSDLMALGLINGTRPVDLNTAFNYDGVRQQSHNSLISSGNLSLLTLAAFFQRQAVGECRSCWGEDKTKCQNFLLLE